MLELDDLVVLLMGAPSKVPALQNRIEGITRLEKLVFLLERESSFGNILTEDTEFKPYNFGPFSANVYKAVNYLSAYGLIEDSAKIADSREDSWEQIRVIDDGHADPYATRVFALTDLGVEYYAALMEGLDDSTRRIDELRKFKHQYAALPLRQLIRYVYNKYPDTTSNSLIRDEVLGNG
ncbi:MAG: hypothetical protein OXH86_14840 [Acidimicrobiaceae bacterium]|nr:hypothetical protein [Acidimicrobiaceae bacterium]